MDNFAPVKVIKLKRDNKFHEPWLTVSICKASSKCRKLAKKAKESGTLLSYEKYRQYRKP